MVFRSKQIANECTARLATLLPRRYALVALAYTLTNSSRQPYSICSHSSRPVRHTLHARSLTKPSLPPVKQAAHSSHLQHPISTYKKILSETSNLINTMTDAMSITSNTSSGKRKRSAPKFYAVRVGRKTGIYHSWEDCKAQTDGIKAECRLHSQRQRMRLTCRQTRASQPSRRRRHS
jgi:hypothetical protein